MGIIEKIISIIAPHRCLGCGLDGSLVCVDCLSHKMPIFDGQIKLDGVKNYYPVHVYQHLTASLVRALKYDRAKHAAWLIAEIVNQNLPDVSWDFVTYAPTSPSRVRRRGYDQSALIAKNFARLRRLKYQPLLVRTSSVRQVGSSKTKRQTQLSGAFVCNANLSNAHILLIDDVSTTGSTLVECAKVLNSSQSNQVDATVFAVKP